MDLSPEHIDQRIKTVRALMQQHQCQALLVPSSDPHLSEYLPEHWQTRQWLSGFTGSMGTLVLTATEAALFTDSRYWVQAMAELHNTCVTLVKIPTGSANLHLEWLSQHLRAGHTVAADAQVLGMAAFQTLSAHLNKHQINLRTDLDIAGDAWPQRPSLPSSPIYEHLAPYVDTERATKLDLVRQVMAEQGASHHLISTLDDVAWLLNLRGSDVSYNPVFLAHVLLDMQQCTLFVGADKITQTLQATLRSEGVHTQDYALCGQALQRLENHAKLLIDPRRTTLGLQNQIPAGVTRTAATNPSTLFKSRKNDKQAQHIRETMRQDGAAMCEFYAWFEHALASKQPLTELDIDHHLSAARARRPGFVGLSFPTIAGFNANGAMPHYRATDSAHARITGDGLLLIDSGGQYLGGTTDITRVWPIGQITRAHQHDYTLVLKGMIALSSTCFPAGTLSPMLDAIARAPLWQHGLDYGHGTGHGVGYFLNVHEGPQSISKAIPEPHMAMQPGMITSIEPGLYRPDQWGIRIENLVLNIPCTSADGQDFLRFETLTLCPIDTRCIDTNLLEPKEIRWLNGYHDLVREKITPLVSGNALAWLEGRTLPL
jgi:Xaa-Pro aminopeptidase